MTELDSAVVECTEKPKLHIPPLLLEGITTSMDDQNAMTQSTAASLLADEAKPQD